ncbi:MAG: hypothetical protein JWP87_1812, partial [Labilithrix sp.]|nr:hypothetical protein [Labilithrix sp.]
MAAIVSPSDSPRPSGAGARERAHLPRRPGRTPGLTTLLVLGMSLARRGILPVASIGICISTAIALSLVTGLLAARGPQSPAHDVPLLASSALAWGGGFLLA